MRNGSPSVNSKVVFSPGSSKSLNGLRAKKGGAGYMRSVCEQFAYQFLMLKEDVKMEQHAFVGLSDTAAACETTPR